MSTAPEFDIKRHLHMVLARKRLFAAVALTVMTLAVLVSYALPKMYEAKSTVFIEKSVINALVKDIAITPDMEAKIKVLTVAILSRTLLLEVVKDLDMDVGLRTEAEREESIKDLQAKTKINLDEERGLFTISFQDKDPRLARDYVNTLVRRYIEQNVSSKREESYEATQFLGEQIDNFRQRIDKADADITDYKREKGLLLAMDEGTLRREISDAQMKLDQFRVRKTELLASRRVMEKTDPMIQQRRTLEKHLETLRAVYTETYPEVLRAKAALEEIDRRIQNRAKDDAPVREDPQQFEQIQVELQSIDRMESLLLQNISRNQQMLREIPPARDRLRELEQEKKNQGLIYEKLLTRFGQSEVSKQMEIQDKSATFRVVDPAILPYKPVSPNRPGIMAMGIAGGLGGAFGLLLLLSQLNPAVKSLAEVKALGLRVMAVIPRIRNPRETANQRRRDRRLYVFCGAYLSCVLALLVMEALGVSLVDAYVSRLDLPGHLARFKNLILS